MDLGTSIVVFVATRGDNAFVGKVLGATALGLYQMAFSLSNLATTEVTNVISQVTFPAYSRLKDSVTSLGRAFVLTLEATVAVSLPLAVGTVMLAPDFVRLFLGKTWMPMVPALQILAVSGLIRSVAATGGPLFRAVGRPKVDFWLNVARVGAMAILIYPLTTRYGLEGTAIAVVFALTATMPVWWIMSCRTIETGHGSFCGTLVRGLFPSLAGTGIMCMSIGLVKWLAYPLGFVSFVLAAVLAIIGCLSTYYFFWKRRNTGPLMAIHGL